MRATVYFSDRIIQDASGFTMYFDPFTTVTIADQNYIWGNAWSQAIANTPTGYTLSSLHNFRAESSGGPMLIYLLKFDITYIRRTGGGGGGES